jgi:hypothetical protein
METEEDIYNPPEPVFYNYMALDKLVNNIDDTVLNNCAVIKICAYEIKNNGTTPYLKYLLHKDDFSDALLFPLLPLTYTNVNCKNVIKMATLKLFTLLQLSNYAEFESKISFKGFFMEHDQEIHIFFDLTECKLQINDIYRINPMWFTLLDEIINQRNVCNFFIEGSVTNFFTNNNDFIYLKNKKGDNYELPVVAYIGMNGINYNKVNFTYTFGTAAKDKTAMLGPYFYFTDFKNSIRQGGWSETGAPVKNDDFVLITDNEYGRYKKGSIVRFALFLGKMKMVENLPNDESDSSLTKKERLEDINLDKHMEMLTMRISDHDGKWTENYDSVFVGKIELDNGEYLKNTPIYILKEYEQQIPLSFHFIDKSYLHEKYDENGDYLII